MSVMQEQSRSGPVLPPGRTRRSFPKEFKADAVALVLDEGRSIASMTRSLGIGESNLGNRCVKRASTVANTSVSRPVSGPNWRGCAWSVTCSNERRLSG